ncbi:MAG: acetyl-CoA hydrolase/transferase C-terminal domain-containing protein [Terriglobales bacterium]
MRAEGVRDLQRQAQHCRGCRGAGSRSKQASTVASLDGVVTDTRMDTQYVVTEHGVVNLLGKSTSERTLALIEIAHPEFRQNLLEQAIRMGIVP